MVISKFWFDVFGETVSVGGMLVAVQSLLTIKKGVISFNFLSNEPYSKFLRHQVGIAKLLSDAFRENTSCGGGGRSSAFRSLWILKRVLKLLITNLMSTLRSSYAHSFYKKKLFMPPGHNLNRCPHGCGGGGGLSFSKTKDWKCLGQGRAWEGGWLPPNHFRLLKRALALSFSNRMSLSKFLRQLLRYEVPLSQKRNKKIYNVPTSLFT